MNPFPETTPTRFTFQGVHARILGDDRNLYVLDSWGNPVQTESKLKDLMRNLHFQPIYRPEPPAFQFVPLSPEKKTWIERARLDVPQNAITCWRSNGMLSYAFYNTLTTWNWVTGETSHVSIPYAITALVEAIDKSLIVLDCKKQIWFESLGFKKPISLPVSADFEITGLLPLDDSHYYLGGKVGKERSKSVVDIQKKEAHAVDWEGYVVLGNGKFLYWKGKEVFIWGKKKTIFALDSDRSICEIIRISEESVLVRLVKQPHAVVLNTQTRKNTDLEEYRLWTQNNSAISQIDSETVAYAYKGDRYPTITFFSLEQKKVLSSAQKGSWGVTSICPLSDGSVMFGTATTPSGIHIATKKGDILFSSQVMTGNGAENPTVIHELVDGSVAIKLGDCTFKIIQPVIDSTKIQQDVDYQIEQAQLEIKHNPYRFDLYHKLADLYKSQENSEACYQVFLAGLEASAKNSKLYLARRFYEKARHIHPDSQDPCNIFLVYLDPSSKYAKRVHLDLCAIKGPNTDLANPNRPCKTRLFVGEGDFSYTEALIQKHQATHPHLPQAITATELKQPEPVAKKKIAKRVETLTRMGVKVLLGIDALKIDQTFKGKRFERIHWNCPFGEARGDRSVFKGAIPAFFQASSVLQMAGDRIHVTLMQEEGYWETRQKENPIVLASTKAGYRLIRKRIFGPERYAGYQHVKTDQHKHDGGKRREFVFQKVNLKEPTNAQELKNPEEKEYSVKTDGVGNEVPLGDWYFECSTDEDSSDYYD